MRKVLVVDDDRDLSAQAAVALDAGGYETKTVGTPEDAVRAIANWKPDLVVLDIMMPAGREGFDVLDTIRGALGLKELPVIIMTGFCTNRGLPFRFAPDRDYLPVSRVLDKPVSPKLLVETVQKVLGDYRIPSETVC